MTMKIDKSVNDMLKRLDNIILGSSATSSSTKWNLNFAEGKKTTQEELDDIETEQYGEPHRFHIYRKARAKKTAPAVGLTYEDVYDSITQEELDWSLRQQLKVSPEQRYQHGKYHWYSHESSWYKRVPERGYDGYGCNDGKCIPECRYYNPIGRIEDSEVIQKHRELEKRYRDNNAIVEPPTTTTTTSSD
jgi:hypothetical protein